MYSLPARARTEQTKCHIARVRDNGLKEKESARIEVDTDLQRHWSLIKWRIVKHNTTNSLLNDIIVELSSIGRDVPRLRSLKVIALWLG